MPYMTVKDGDGYAVHKQGPDKKPMGKPMNKKPMTKDQATKYMQALYANESKSLSETEIVALEEKCYNDDYSHRKVWQDDPRAAYDAMGGRTGDKACANCFWFNPGSASCEVVGGPIVATGLSKMWMPQQNEMPEMSPMPVYIVEEPTAAGEMALPVEPKAKSLLEKVIDFIGLKSTEPVNEGFKVLPDGRWQAWWTNNAKDKVGEWFSAKAIDAYIARVDSGAVPYPELWYKHLPIRMGKADALARIGYLTFATGKFYDTPTGQKGRAYFEAEQKAGHVKTNSHGYLYPTNLLKKGVYNAFNTFEISVLDPGEEANPYTMFEVKTMFAKLDQKKFDALEKIFGKEAVEELTNFAETKSRELEAAGVDVKSFSSFDGVEVEDKTAHAAVKALGEATLEGLKAINTRLDVITESVKAVQTSVDTKTEASAKAVADLKAYVQGELGYTPRASKAAETQLAATDAQVTHLQQKIAEAAQNKGDELPEGVTEFGKGVFAEIAKAMKTQS